MADLAEQIISGPLSLHARSQYKALASMRWSMFRNSLRTTQGAIELGARTVAYVFYAFVGIVLSVGFGFGAYFVAASGKWPVMAVLLWVLCVMWQAVPVMLSSFQEQFDLVGLLRFPVGFGTYCVLHLVFGLVDASTIMGCSCCLGIWIGMTVTRPDLLVWAALILAVFAVFNVLLVRAIAAWIDRWMAQRRTREIVGALFFTALLSLQLLNPAFHSQSRPRIPSRSHPVAIPALKTLNRVQRWLPPGLAALGLERSATSSPATTLEAVSLLGLYALGTGVVLGVRLRAEYRGENFNDAPARTTTERRTRTWLIEGSGPIAAVMEKEARVLMRAMPLLYGLAAPLLMVFVLSGLFIKHGAAAGYANPMSLLVSLAYALVGFTQLFYNNLGPEGAGIQMLFLSPTPMRTVLLAKNLFHAALFLADAVLVSIVASLRIGWPPPAALAATAAWMLFALPVHLAVGDAFSLNMPYRMNLGRITRQRGSQASALLSMLIQLGVLGIGVGVFVACAFFHKFWLAVPVLLVLATGAVFAWVRVLNHVDAMAARRRESLIATLVRTE